MSWTRGHKLGHGSTATVYLATAHRSGEQFAVKSAELSNSEFLQREQRILSSISSPYVIGYRGFEITTEGVDGKVFYNLLLDYVPGGTMIDEIRRRGGGRMGESAVGSYTWQVVKALEYLHSNGIAHCDVKGRNILVGPGESAKLADFGCSKRVGSSSGIGGTPMFMAPEAARGEEQGFAGDVWGLGCAVIEMATGGGSPWTETADDDPVSAIYRVGYSDRVPDFPGWFSEQGKDFLGKCLRRDPKQRWTASQLLTHPFLAKFEDSTPESTAKIPSFDSPTSILDNGFWNSVVSDSEEASSSPEEEEDEEEEDEAEARGRIGRLGMEDSVGPSWDEDDCGRWITVRENGCERGGDDDLVMEESLESGYSVISRSLGVSLGGCKYERSFGVSCNLGFERVRQDGDVSLSLIASQA